MKKRLLLIASLPLTIAVTLGVLARLPSSPGVTKANFDRIEKGMTKAQVEEIFGGKPHAFLPVFSRTGMILKQDGMPVWKANDGSNAFVVFFEDDCVTDKEWQDSDETILDKIRRWLHLP